MKQKLLKSFGDICLCFSLLDPTGHTSFFAVVQGIYEYYSFVKSTHCTISAWPLGNSGDQSWLLKPIMFLKGFGLYTILFSSVFFRGFFLELFYAHLTLKCFKYIFLMYNHIVGNVTFVEQDSRWNVTSKRSECFFGLLREGIKISNRMTKIQTFGHFFVYRTMKVAQVFHCLLKNIYEIHFKGKLDFI